VMNSAYKTMELPLLPGHVGLAAAILLRHHQHLKTAILPETVWQRWQQGCEGSSRQLSELQLLLMNCLSSS
jgi:hypothetical protein